MGGEDLVPASEKESGKAVDLTPPNFTVDDIVAQIKGRLSTASDGMTNREITTALGFPPTKANMGRVYNQLNDLMALGIIEYVGRKEVIGPTGRKKRVEAYALKRREGEK